MYLALGEHNACESSWVLGDKEVEREAGMPPLERWASEIASCCAGFCCASVVPSGLRPPRHPERGESKVKRRQQPRTTARWCTRCHCSPNRPAASIGGDLPSRGPPTRRPRGLVLGFAGGAPRRRRVRPSNTHLHPPAPPAPRGPPPLHRRRLRPYAGARS